MKDQPETDLNPDDNNPVAIGDKCEEYGHDNEVKAASLHKKTKWIKEKMMSCSSGMKEKSDDVEANAESHPVASNEAEDQISKGVDNQDKDICEEQGSDFSKFKRTEWIKAKMLPCTSGMKEKLYKQEEKPEDQQISELETEKQVPEEGEFQKEVENEEDAPGSSKINKSKWIKAKIMVCTSGIKEEITNDLQPTIGDNVVEDTILKVVEDEDENGQDKLEIGDSTIAKRSKWIKEKLLSCAGAIEKTSGDVEETIEDQPTTGIEAAETISRGTEDEDIQTCEEQVRGSSLFRGSKWLTAKMMPCTRGIKEETADIQQPNIEDNAIEEQIMKVVEDEDENGQDKLEIEDYTMSKRSRGIKARLLSCAGGFEKKPVDVEENIEDQPTTGVDAAEQTLEDTDDDNNQCEEKVSFFKGSKWIKDKMMPCTKEIKEPTDIGDIQENQATVVEDTGEYGQDQELSDSNMSKKTKWMKVKMLPCTSGIKENEFVVDEINVDDDLESGFEKYEQNPGVVQVKDTDIGEEQAKYPSSEKRFSSKIAKILSCTTESKLSLNEDEHIVVYDSAVGLELEDLILKIEEDQEDGQEEILGSSSMHKRYKWIKSKMLPCTSGIKEDIITDSETKKEDVPEASLEVYEPILMSVQGQDDGKDDDKVPGSIMSKKSGLKRSRMCPCVSANKNSLTEDEQNNVGEAVIGLEPEDLILKKEEDQEDGHEEIREISSMHKKSKWIKSKMLPCTSGIKEDIITDNEVNEEDIPETRTQIEESILNVVEDQDDDEGDGKVPAYKVSKKSSNKKMKICPCVSTKHRATKVDRDGKEEFVGSHAEEIQILDMTTKECEEQVEASDIISPAKLRKSQLMSCCVGKKGIDSQDGEVDIEDRQAADQEVEKDMLDVVEDQAGDGFEGDASNPGRGRSRSKMSGMCFCVSRNETKSVMVEPTAHGDEDANEDLEVDIAHHDDEEQAKLGKKSKSKMGGMCACVSGKKSDASQDIENTAVIGLEIIN